MARGWESKSVEDQIRARESESQKTTPAKVTAKQRELQSKRDGLLLMRIRTLSAIQSARSEIYRQQQERALEHIEAQLADLEADQTQS